MNSGACVQDPCKQFKAGGVRGLHCILLWNYECHCLNWNMTNPGLSTPVSQILSHPFDFPTVIVHIIIKKPIEQTCCHITDIIHSLVTLCSVKYTDICLYCIGYFIVVVVCFKPKNPKNNKKIFESMKNIWHQPDCNTCLFRFHTIQSTQSTVKCLRRCNTDPL